MTIRIAIVGPMCSGKSTLVKKIIDYYIYKGINIEKRAFADKVYDIAYNLFNMRTKDRKLLQQIGTKMREIDKDILIKYTLQNLPDNIIIEDCRYENELDYLIKYGFIIIKIDISKDIQLERLQKTYPKNWQYHLKNINHESEANLQNINKSKFNYIINYDYRFTDIINII